jgi:hypothetical protein
MLTDKLGQEITVGMYVIKPWNGVFDLGRVIKVGEDRFTYEYRVEHFTSGRTIQSVCKVPNRCLVIPEIMANYWSILDF